MGKPESLSGLSVRVYESMVPSLNLRCAQKVLIAGANLQRMSWLVA